MAEDKKISDLPSVTSFADIDLFVLVHGHTSNVTWLVMKGLIHDYLATQNAAFSVSQSIKSTTNQLVLGNLSTVTINSIAPAASRIYSINYDIGAAANFVLAKGSTAKQMKFDISSSADNKTLTLLSNHTDDRTITFPDASGVIALTGEYPSSFTKVYLTDTSNQLILGTTNTTTINALPPAASSTVSIQDCGTFTNLIQSIGSTAKKVKFDISGSTDSKTLTIASLHSIDRIVTIQNLPQPTNLVQSYGTAAKFIRFNASGSTDNKVMTITSNHTDDRTVTLPNKSGNLILSVNTTFSTFLTGPWDHNIAITITIVGTTFNSPEFIMLQFPAATAASYNATNITLTDHLPVDYRPSINIDLPIFVVDNYAVVPGNIRVETDGHVSIGVGHDGNFTPTAGAGTAGLVGFTVSFT